MPTAAQIRANRENARKSTGPRTETGKAKSSRNHLSHGFTSALLFIPGENPEDFNNLLADLQAEFQPATTSEQMLLEKMVQHQWLSLRAYRLQAAGLTASLSFGQIDPELGVLIRYHQSSDRAFLRFRTELVNTQKERKKSEIGFESQNSEMAAETPVAAPAETSTEPSQPAAETLIDPPAEPPQPAAETPAPAAAPSAPAPNPPRTPEMPSMSPLPAQPQARKRFIEAYIAQRKESSKAA